MTMMMIAVKRRRNSSCHN